MLEVRQDACMEHLDRQTRIRALAALATAVVMWASAFIAIRIAVRSYSPVHLSAMRIGIAAVLLGGIALVRGLKMPSAKDLAVLVFLGLTGQALYQVLLNTGELSVDAGTASLLIAIAPVLASLMAVLFLGERLTKAGWVGTGIAFAGAATIALGGHSAAPQVGRGTLLVLGATGVWALFLVVQKTVASRNGSLELTAIPMGVGALALAPFARTLPASIAAAPLSATLAVLFLGCFSSVIGFLAWAYAIQRLRVVMAMSALYTVPVVALFIGWTVLREVPAPMALLGGAIALGGVALTGLKGHPVGGDEMPVERIEEASA